MTIRHIIFDCDGVLIDSEEISMAVDRMLLAENGVHLSEGEMHRRFVGKTFKAMIDEVEAECGRRMPADLEARIVEIMSADVMSVGPEADATEVIDLMVDTRVGAVPVVDQDGGARVGIISYIDVLRQLRDKLSSEEGED